jgi:hypothetical protein
VDELLQSTHQSSQQSTSHDRNDPSWNLNESRVVESPHTYSPAYGRGLNGVSALEVAREVQHALDHTVGSLNALSLQALNIQDSVRQLVSCLEFQDQVQSMRGIALDSRGWNGIGTSHRWRMIRPRSSAHR